MSMWDERYSAPDYVYGTEPNGFLKSIASQIPSGSKVLSLAEGEGRNAVYLAGLGCSVCAVDASAVGLRKAEKLASQKGVMIQTVVADLSEYEIEPSAWDAIVSIFCHVPSDVRRKLHQKVVRGLKAGGIFILEAYTPAQLAFKTGGPPNEDLMMTLSGLKNELAGLEFRHGVEIERDIIEGQYHTGPGAVVQMIGVKTK